ncbi:ubiquitin carboxyl-terminal hydrolase 18 isoform X2 [Solanum dulcamara]|uniref:ubiquitin carboxyl-terminal hydrolase 18 isoform X2 n=1 Tax=Solanum dulcamara TaxID=45834 RepID=UPI002486439D|nr:ubiquitin carboxyl-terminal hydrolase 18 isoform X2 [Solanum dulcamara]
MKMPQANGCAVCGNVTSKRCSRCKRVTYCSEACQRSDWNSGHKYGCRDFQSSVKGNSEQSASTLQRRKSFGNSLVPFSGNYNLLNQSKKVLFPYEEFLEFFYWDSPGYPPCGLINCGNSCFANVVLQCLTQTKPLVAYLLEKDHKKECRSNDWCFLCEFQQHVEKASWCRYPFSPIGILSVLPNIGGNLSCEKQEDAHEFMRFAIDTMQSVLLDEFDGDKAVPLSAQETIIQHIFGGHLQSRVQCTKCGNISNQYENMMDLTVEIHEDADSLEECLDRYSAEECMDGENMYKCDRCDDYVKAWKRLTIRKAPNILTIALKRFQREGFGKLNKRVIFPENLDLNPNMSEAGDHNDFFQLYAVIVHVDMLNASSYGHYICYIKDFSGNWYRVDDTEVADVHISVVLSEEAYMLLYSRMTARPTSLYILESLNKEDHAILKAESKQYSPLQPLECHKTAVCPAMCADPGSLPTDNRSEIVSAEEELSSVTTFEGGKEDQDMVDSGASCRVLQELQDVGDASADEATYRLRMLSPWSFMDSSDEAVIQKPEGRFLVSDIEEEAETCKGIAYESLLGSSREDSVATNGDYRCAKQEVRGEVCQNSTLCDPTNACAQSGLSCEKPKLKPLSTPPGFLGKRPRDKRPRDKRPRDKCAKQEVRGEACQNSTLCDPTNACAQSGLSCEKPKLKPLFTPGFLVKRPRDKCAKQEVSGEVCQNSTLCDPTNTCTQSGLSCEKPKLKPLFTPGFLGKRPRDKCAKQEVRGEVCQNSTLCDPTNACAQSGLSCEKPEK